MSHESSTTKMAQYRTARLVSRALRSHSKPQEMSVSPEHMEMFQNVYSTRSSLGSIPDRSSMARPMSKSKKMPLSIGSYDMFIIPRQESPLPPPEHDFGSSLSALSIDIDTVPAPPPFSPPASPEIPPPPDTTPPPSPSPLPDKRYRNMMEQLNAQLAAPPANAPNKPPAPPPPPRPQNKPPPPPPPVVAPVPRRPVAAAPAVPIPKPGDELSPHEVLCREISRGVKLRHVSIRGDHVGKKKHGHGVSADSAFAHILARRRHLESFATVNGDQGRESFL